MKGSSLGEVFRLYLQEMRRPAHYIVALGVGSLLTLIARLDLSLPIAPFIVPFLVSSVGRTVARAANRKNEQLLELPAQRASPGFVICRDGRIEAAAGKTAELFERLAVKRIHDFLVCPEQPDVIDTICSGTPVDPAAEVYAPAEKRWYRVFTHSSPRQPSVLVWLEDVTEEHEGRERRHMLRAFQIDALESASNDPVVQQGDERLARLILGGGFSAVLFAQLDADGALVGSAFKESDGDTLERSAPIRICPDSHAPIFRSRTENRAIAASRRQGRSGAAGEFELEFPVAAEVQEFLNQRVDNLVNYHAGPTSIVAFNKRPSLTRSDITFLEAAVDAAHSLFAAIDVARDRDLRFIQAIHGLCASAEFSDEITGSHIWRVNAYSELLARSLCSDGPLCRDIGQVAAAHDIGKVAMPELVHAPRALSRSEWARMQLHTVFGAQILDRMIQLGENADPRLTMAREIALNHHQRWDGKGYPGLLDSAGRHVALESRDAGTYTALRPPKGTEIPLAARVVSVCDAYDALRSQRPYKAGFDHETAVALIGHDDRTDASGADRFGPDVFEAFMDLRERFAEIFADSNEKAS
ncbi:MAG: HD domain-containing protein [Spirochaetaceae bacterium]|nr:MAG: HD domain-containing protein [Spirochaetaceae bacterium]